METDEIIKQVIHLLSENFLKNQGEIQIILIDFYGKNNIPDSLRKVIDKEIKTNWCKFTQTTFLGHIEKLLKEESYWED